MTREIDTQTLVRPSKFAHVVLRTRNVSRSARWYETVVGMKPAFENDFVAFLTYDDEHHRLALVMTPQEEAAPKGAAGLDHIAYTLGDLGELLGTYERLKGIGIAPVWCINHGPTTSIYYEDPDGNRVEFQVENFEKAADIEAFLESGAFQKNPIGVDFDPDILATRFRDGDSIEELKKQGSAGPA